MLKRCEAIFSSKYLFYLKMSRKNSQCVIIFLAFDVTIQYDRDEHSEALILFLDVNFHEGKM